jgi:CheY-like chemotaxis protein
VVVPDLGHAQATAQQLMPQTVIVDKACEPLNSRELERLAQTWELAHTSFVACPLPGEELLRQQMAVEGYLIKPVSRQSLWDVLRQFGEHVDRVLVIDDDQDFVLLMSRMLEDSPIRRYRVATAFSGQEGLMMIRQRRPDLVLLDLELPDIHGLQVIEDIRSHPEWRDIPIVIVSAQGELENQETLTGSVTLTKANGLTPGEVVQWVQHMVDTTITRLLAPPVLPEVSAL